MDDLTPVAKRQKRIKNFTAGEKRELIKAVEEWPRIWDITNVMHSNKNAVEQAWVHISNSVGKTVNECKAGWISLQESCRYHAKVARKYKSGSAGGETLEEPFFSDAIDWDFAEEMAFLPNTSHKRTPTFEDFDSASPINRANEEVLSVPQYDYNPTPTTSSRTFRGSQNDEAWNRFNNILKKQEDLVAAKNNSSYAQVLASFEWLLNKLPRSVGDDMCMEFYSMLLQNVNELKSKN
ncbi:uncharacterized protein LOC126765333 isoform X1 [Bactrocera neohumeralis]|uniref:uncharacterized protein LOC120768543 isoform X3 n=1 Tax=Bactrocera tryoni TaxID=59916 RepID=UPI001A964187|nr:uncharacterized protein LOC120768543 isoform X3 [Bactrocera tryoni]XP_050339011.1 uncharacterized protein LOC126765332 isoform X1 [Bactrocera neohumeralis]XP_050339013.1 uncharacterized protein LOC126765333 isoform X1 [Bactrocera neohumeralis]